MRRKRTIRPRRTKIKQTEQKRGQEKARSEKENKQPTHPPSGPLTSSAAVVGLMAAQAHQQFRAHNATLVTHGRWRRCGRIPRIQRGPGRTLGGYGGRRGYTHIARTDPLFTRSLARLFVATPARRCNKTTSKFKKRCVNGMQDLSLDAKFQPHPPGSLLARQAAVARLVAALAHQQPWCRSAMRAEVHRVCING